MAEHAVKDAPQHETAPHADEHQAPTRPFDEHDVRQFKADDAEAVTAIGKMLVAFFFYSLIVMAIVTWLAAIAWY